MWNCHIYIKFKLLRQKTQSWLHFFLISEHCWYNVFMNYVDSLSLSTFMNIIYWYILVFIDCFTKIRHLIPIISMKIKEAIECYYNLSESLVSDKSMQFTFNIWQHLYQMLKINIKLFIMYHSEMNKQTERVNAVMKHYFQAFVNYMQDDWVK